MRDNNILSRFIKPAARLIGLPFVNWRCLRTSHATWLKMSGADVKDAQAQLRHSRASTTLDIYQQFVPFSQLVVTDIPYANTCGVPRSVAPLTDAALTRPSPKVVRRPATHSKGVGQHLRPIGSFLWLCIIE